MSNSRKSGNGGEKADSVEVAVERYFSDITSDNEELYSGFISPEGITRIKGDDTLVVDQPVVTVVTDCRILFTTPSKGAAGVVALGYEELLSVSVVEKTLELTTVSGVALEWPLGPELSGTESAVKHLRWIGTVRNQFRSCRNDIELAVGEIRACAQSREWEVATETYQQAREQLDEICNLVFATEGVDEQTLVPDLTEIERSLETAYARLYIERTNSQLDLGRQLLENGDYIQGRRVLQQTQQYYRQAQKHSDAVERGDAFQFGAQRDLNEELQRLGWQIETVAAEPIKQAHEEKVKAKAADQPETKLDHWERAFERYGQVLTLEWGTEERNFAGDPDAIRAELCVTAERLIELHTERGEQCWAESKENAETGDQKPALRGALDAQEHFERAHELVTEFAPDRVEPIANRCEEVTDTVKRLRNGPGGSERSEAEPSDETASKSDQSTTQTADNKSNSVPKRRPPTDTDQSDDSRSLPSASSLAEMDTHHEVTLDVDGLTVPSTENDESGWDVLKREIDGDETDEQSDSTNKTSQH